jgi:hypothetical protein
MSYSFDGYTVRPVREQDRKYLENLISADPFHKGRMTADFFLNLEPGEDAWALEDEQGGVIFYFRTSTVVRMAIQFGASGTRLDRARNQLGLIKGLRWIEQMFRQNKFTEIIFDSEGDALRQFARRHLGFSDRPTLTKLLNGKEAENVWAEFAGTNHQQ